MINKYIIALTLSLTAFSVSAQEINPKAFIEQYDQNQDQTLDEQEFNQLKDFAPYSYSNNFQGKNSHHKIFKQLDQNHDGKVSRSELQQLDQVIENQYIGWVWTLDANQVL